MTYSLAERGIREMIMECDDIIDGEHGELTQEHIDGLMSQMQGFGIYLRMTGATWLLGNKTVEGVKQVKGWLIANAANLTTAKGATSITNNNQSSAKADVSVSVRQTVEATRKSELSPEDKDALELAISRMRTAAEAKDEKGFAEKLSDAIDIASKAAGLIPAVVQAAGQLSSLL